MPASAPLLQLAHSHHLLSEPELSPHVTMSSAQDRLAQVSSHLNYPKGMLAGQVAIITGSGQGIGQSRSSQSLNYPH